MAVINCKMCGSPLPMNPGVTVVECEYCGREQTVPSMDNEKKLTLFARAERLRAACEFDKAFAVFESIVAEFPKEAEAYWGLVLCKYGIEYVDDPATREKIPTCHRSSFDRVVDDLDYEQALVNSDVVTRKVYCQQARQIEELRKDIISVSANENPYDVFICYKETDLNGRRTLDSVIAQDIYNMLTEKGYRVFFSRITLKDKLGMEYEPYIFAALNSAKVMLSIGTNIDYYNAIWVKNEWSRFLKLMAQDRSKKLFPIYKGISAYDLPQEFQRLQALNYGELGADQDLMMAMEKIIPIAKPIPAYVPQQPVYAPQAQPMYAPQPASSNDSSIQKALKEIRSGSKLGAIKVIRDAYGLGLKEAKDWVDDAAAGIVRPLTCVVEPMSSVQPTASSVALSPAQQEAVALVRERRMLEAIKVIRAAHGLGLKEAKDWCDAAAQGKFLPLGRP